MHNICICKSKRKNKANYMLHLSTSFIYIQFTCFSATDCSLLHCIPPLSSAAHSQLCPSIPHTSGRRFALKFSGTRMPVLFCQDYISWMINPAHPSLIHTSTLRKQCRIHWLIHISNRTQNTFILFAKVCDLFSQNTISVCNMWSTVLPNFCSSHCHFSHKHCSETKITDWL